MTKEEIKKNLINSELRDNEDMPVLDYLTTNYNKKIGINFLEVGSGLCRFVDKLNTIYPSINITCFEINEKLAEIAIRNNYNVINEDFINNNIASNSYDIVHCSHVIEHFTYPKVAKVIDELLRITKIGGVCIIRSPLMWEKFYFDLDHIRPYPPEAIIYYLNSEQQQLKGKNEVKTELIWFRTIPKKFNMIDKYSFFYPSMFLRDFLNKRIIWLNRKMEISWNKYRWPAGKPNGYVLILKKIS